CESIAERSRLHDWEIRPHRHERLFQLFWIEQGGCALSLDGQEQALQGPAVLLIPPLAVHGFRFQPEPQGQVVTVQAEHLAKLLASEPALEKRLLRAQAQRLDAQQAGSIAAAMQALREEFAGAANWRSMGVDSALSRLLVCLGRALDGGAANIPNIPNVPNTPSPRALRHVQCFRALIEQRYREQPGLAACAAEIGITPTQLNRVCRQVLDCSAAAVLHARLLLEAQRELAYTTMSIQQIAHALGFADAAYFSRFYLRKTGLTPGAWRRRALQRLG
ncbi:MAG: helix-turn-helix domain-containing protein, partial [Burkholderiaceae bacterium]